MITIQRRQKGAALIIGLVLLTVLTLLTASSMSSSTLSLRMADNVKQRNVASQAAESALMQALTSTVPYTISGPINGMARADQEFIYDDGSAGNATTIVQTMLKDRLSPTTGCELDAKFGGSACRHQHFEMLAQSSSARGGGQQQIMGYYLRVPN